jgi:hypothetical protein
MPTTRTKRRRKQEVPPAVVNLLLEGQPIEKTEENRQQLLELIYFGWIDHPDSPKLPDLAWRELQRRWKDD